MNNIFPKDLLKVVVDTAKEISASGETIHQTFGELSISLERLLTKTVKVTDGNDGSKITETKEWLTDKEEQKELVKNYYKQANELLEQVYENQRHTKQLIFNITSLILLVIFTIFFLLPLINKTTIVFTLSNEKFSSIISIAVAIFILLASYFQWWQIQYNGGMKIKTWVKWLFGFCIALLLISLYLLMR